MRELKFRGKLLKDSDSFKTYKKGIFIQGGIYKEVDKTFIVAHSNIFEVDPKTVGQFVGLVDKNEDEIFEGDILINDEFKRPFLVRYNLCGFDAIFEKNLALGLYPKLKHEKGSCHVIGNMHDDLKLYNSLNLHVQKTVKMKI